MLSINDLKVGSRILFNSQPHQIIYTEHSKLGRGGGILRTRIKNLVNGTIVEKTFAGAEKVEEVELETRLAQFLYKEGDQFNFMDSTNYEQFSLAKGQLGTTADFLKDGQEVTIIYYQEKPINVSLPVKINLKVTYTEPGFKGNTSSAPQKPATLETGAEIHVPLFIKQGDEIVVDTRTGAYVERA